MTTKGTLDIERLVDDLRDAGYTVALLGARYRVTNPDGGDPVFIPKRLPKNGRATSVADLMQVLKRIGFDAEQAEEAREKARQERLAADKQGESAALKKAQAEADARPAPSEVQALIRQRISPEASTSVPGAPLEPRTEVMTIDADFAAALLQHNRFYTREGKLDAAAGMARTNRPFSPERANKYRDAILRGEWTLTHQGIALDVEGSLVDGQHRLVGLVLAAEQVPGTSIRSMVTYDLEPQAFDKVDIGGKRTVGDVLAAHGEKFGSGLAAVARLVIFYDHKRSVSEWASAHITPDQARALIEKEPEIREAARWGAYLPIGLPAAEGAARHLILRECGDTGRRFARDFFEAFRSGAGLELGAPALLLRNVLINQKTNTKRKRDGLEQFALIIKAWNADAAGKPVKTLMWKAVEELPRVVSLR